MNGAGDDQVAQAARSLAAVEGNVSRLVSELEDSCNQFRMRSAQRARGDISLGAPRVVNRARARVVKAVEAANEFGQSADFGRVSHATAERLKGATIAALHLIATSEVLA